MYTGSLIFTQVMDFMPPHTFRRCIARYQGNKNVRSFTCLDQYLCMAFAQLTYRESLRDIEACLQAQQQKLYHMGIRGNVAKSNLADANEQGDWRIYADLAHSLILTARTLYSNEPFGVDLQQTVYALDATTIDLCLSMFPWATFRQTKAAIKLHTLLHLRGNIPTFISISDGKVHNVNILDVLPIEPGGLLHNGPWLSGLCQTLYSLSGSRVLCNQNKVQLQMPQSLFSSCRPLNWYPVRPNNYAYRVLFSQRLSGQAAARQILRRRNRENTGIPNKQFLAASLDHSTAISLPMAGGDLLQMDQTKPTHQKFLWHFGERSENSNMDRSFSLCAGSHTKETAQYTGESLHNFTNSERLDFRKNTVITATYRNSHATGNIGSRKPVEFIHLTVGQL